MPVTKVDSEFISRHRARLDGAAQVTLPAADMRALLDAAELGARVASLTTLCKGEYSSLHIDLNDHHSSYQSAAQAIEENDHGWFDEDRFPSPQERQRCIDTDTIWHIQWYPDTPVGFYSVKASTLLDAINAALPPPPEETA